MATYVISDIHGCFEKFQQMLQKIGLGNNDILYLAGDYIDRGSQSLEMLKWLENCPSNVHPIKGNHDAEFYENMIIMREIDHSEKLDTDPDSNKDALVLLDSVRYMLKKKNAGGLKYFDYYGTIEDLLKNRGVTFGELCRWSDMLDSYQFFYRFPVKNRDCIIVHAGYCDDEELLPDKFRTREQFCLYAREESVFIGGVKNGLVVAGHTPTIAEGTAFFTGGKVFRFHDREKNCIFYDIDCGCVFSHVYPSARLSCIRLEDEKVFYI